MARRAFRRPAGRLARCLPGRLDEGAELDFLLFVPRGQTAAGFRHLVTGRGDPFFGILEQAIDFLAALDNLLQDLLDDGRVRTLGDILVVQCGRLVGEAALRRGEGIGQIL